MRLTIYTDLFTLNISDFNLLFMSKLQPPWKKSPRSFPATPSKSWGPVKSFLFENLVGGSTLPSSAERGGGAHHTTNLTSYLFIPLVVAMSMWKWQVALLPICQVCICRHEWNDSQKTEAISLMLQQLCQNSYIQ